MKYFFIISILALMLLIQSTLLNFIPFFDKVKPDLALIFLIFVSTQFGSVFGMYTGFISGLIESFTSGFLGLHSFIKTLTGFVFGLGKGNVYYDPFFIPVIMAFFGTIFKAILRFVLFLIFNLKSNPFNEVFNSGLIFELLFNIIFAPLLFLFFNFVKKKMSGPGRTLDD